MYLNIFVVMKPPQQLFLGRFIVISSIGKLQVSFRTVFHGSQFEAFSAAWPISFGQKPASRRSWQNKYSTNHYHCPIHDSEPARRVYVPFWYQARELVTTDFKFLRSEKCLVAAQSTVVTKLRRIQQTNTQISCIMK